MDAKITSAVLPQVLLRRRIHRTNQSYHWQGKRALLFKALRSSLDRKRAAGDERA